MSFHNTLSYAQQMDANDELKEFRNRYYMPQHNGKDVIYYTGNSLGLQPKATADYVMQELKDWAELGVEGHFRAKHPWFPYHEFLRDASAKIVGALPSEVVVMNQLTVNLHLMLTSFYQPTAERFKIIFETNPFPSDRYALASHAYLHGFELDDVLVELQPRHGELTMRTEDIIKTIEEHGDELALVMIGGVNYYTGQAFDMEAITLAAHKAGAKCGFDLAHAAGNIKLNLHKWNVDFAVWCSYKYLNSGPGAVAGCFVHQHHATNFQLPRLAGWWGNDPSTRFEMGKDFIPKEGADGWQLSNAPVMSMACHRAALAVFEEAGMEKLLVKSRALTDYLEFVIDDVLQKSNKQDLIEMITPRDAAQRGCQLSLRVTKNGKKIHQALTENGVVADWREPDVIRVAPVPMYNTFEDAFRFGEILAQNI
jgi:kynureninase